MALAKVSSAGRGGLAGFRLLSPPPRPRSNEEDADDGAASNDEAADDGAASNEEAA
jgi:hypothetical protein